MKKLLWGEWGESMVEMRVNGLSLLKQSWSVLKRKESQSYGSDSQGERVLFVLW